MSRLPPIRTDSDESLISTLRIWKQILDGRVANEDVPLPPPRNTRTETPRSNMIRFRWDPGSKSGEGFEAAYTDWADFRESQSHRSKGLSVHFFDLPVNDTDKRYFRVRVWSGDRVSQWSPIVSGVAEISVQAGAVAGDPGSVSFTPFLPEQKYGVLGLKNIALTGNADLIHVWVAVVDERLTPFFYGEILANMDASTNPLSVSCQVTFRTVATPTSLETETPGFAVNDLVIFDDPAQDAGNPTLRSYAIYKITQITGSQPGTVTIQFTRQEGGGYAYLRSYMTSHPGGTRFYKVGIQHFTIPTKNETGYTALEKEELPLGSYCVVAAAMAASDVGTIGTAIWVNCSQIAYPFPGDEYSIPPAPGMRTCNGLEYHLGIAGPLFQYSFLTNFVWVTESTSIRGAAAWCRLKPAGVDSIYQGLLKNVPNASCAAYVIYVEPRHPLVAEKDRRVAVIEQITIIEGQYDNFSLQTMGLFNPDVRRTPFHLLWPCTHFPVVGTLETLFDLDSGLMREGVFPLAATGERIEFTEGGQLSLIVDRAGSDTAGSDLSVALLT